MTLSESWIPLDIDVEEPAVPVRPGPGQNVVGMIATPGARARGWTRRAAVEVCRGWAQDGSRILLCDVAFEDPELHEVAGLYNQEGMTDALLFGSSFRRLGQPLADGFLLATAGTAVPDPAALRAHPRWADFAGGFTEAGAVLVLYLPSDASGVEALYELCDTVVVLGDRTEVDGLGLSPALGPLAVFGPHPDSGGPSVGGIDEGDLGGALEPTPVLEGEESAAAPPAGVTEAGGGADGPEPRPRETVAPAGANASGVGSSAVGAEDVAAPAAGGGRNPAFLVGAALVVLALILAVTGVLPLPGGGSGAEGDGDVATVPEATPAPETERDGDPEAGDAVDSAPLEAEPAVAGPVGLDAAPVARFVLAVASYESLNAAFGDIVALRSAMPEAHLVISPVVVNDRVWYRMSAGTAATSGEIEALRDRLAEGRPEAANWRIREAGLGFLVDEYSSFAEADQRVALLAEQDVPAHILAYRDDDGADRFRIYAGAYGTPAEARYMEGFLQEGSAALRDLPLVERRGFRPE